MSDKVVKTEEMEEQKDGGVGKEEVRKEQHEDATEGQSGESNVKSAQLEDGTAGHGESNPNVARVEDTTAQIAPSSTAAPPADDDDKPKSKPRTQTEKLKAKLDKQKQKAYAKAHPPGGYDATPIPPAADGYTVRFTFVRAENLPMADLSTGAADPFVVATLTSPGITPRHKQDPEMRLRTRTIHKDTNPHWDQEWIVAGVPSSGFRLKCRIYDEDSRDSDDRLGNVTVVVARIGSEWPGIHEQSYPVKKRMGSWRAYLVQGITAMCTCDVDFTARLVLSVEVLGKSEEPYGRMYTLGPGMWTKHYSPMIGRIAGTKAPYTEDGAHGEKGAVEKYDFQANQLQLRGPVPPALYHRFVEFRPFVKGMFDKTGLRGHVLNAALHHQHAHVYNYSHTTRYGVVEPCTRAAALQFLTMAHFDDGSRLFTYVLTLDGLLRFTETGKEFGIDLLSKHTMHSDVNVYIACSGEFFIRRIGGDPDAVEPQPEDFELVIDNDSGTYRPNGALLPQLRAFLAENLPGLRIVTRDCADEKLQRMKREQREKKKRGGGGAVRVAANSDGGWSSSDEESLVDRERGKRSKRERVFEAIEDPEAAIRGLRGKGREGEERTEEGERTEEVGEGSGSK